MVENALDQGSRAGREAKGGDLKRIAASIRAGDRAAVLEEVSTRDPIHIADLLVSLPLARAEQLYGWLPAGLAVVVLEAMNPGLRALLLQHADAKRVAEITDELEDDDAAELLADFPAETREQVLALLPRRASLVRRFAYGEDTAGLIMSNRFVAVVEDWDIGMATRAIRRSAADIEILHEVYVVSEARQLVGRLKLRDLLLHKRKVKLKDIMRPVRVSVTPNADQEEVVRLAEKYRVQAVPVLDQAERVIGRITLDELREIVRDEADEDIKLMSGVAPDSRADSSVRAMVKGRLPWLIGGLFGASLAAMVVGSFEEELAKAAILASFIPIVMAMAGNAGIQAATITVQGLAGGELWAGDSLKRIGKELVGATINGCVIAALLALMVLVADQVIDIHAPAKLALAGGLALVAVTALAATLGASVPLILQRVGVDPAVATGVFITTCNDIFSVLIFFLLATSIYIGA